MLAFYMHTKKIFYSYSHTNICKQIFLLLKLSLIDTFHSQNRECLSLAVSLAAYHYHYLSGCHIPCLCDAKPPHFT